ncbi:sulfite exporter TauE/SafE family protein [Actinomyces capricornis]|uniref:Probable membrane transporter protein n=1 Tax=Actinomyces capricornis TaxID=2755559 RepID=A0ABN6K821_9ACTO|nr:sulfite exporter TauE/SafE family protein [Actinomyces capricornis]BDA65746.1 UPF0721 transmembrane protein [Actinomyces capricornis]
MTFLAAVVAGLLIGVVVGALGAGGGVLSVPVLTYVLGQSPHDAAAGSLLIVGLTALVSLRSAARDRRVRWRDGLLFGVLSIVGSVLGARASVRLDELLLMRLFCTLLLVVGLIMLRRGLSARRALLAGGGTAGTGAAPARQERRRRGLPGIALAATATGLLTGFFGVGGGFIVVPMLALALGFPIKEAAGTSLLVMVIASVTGLLARVGTGVVIDWPVVLLFAGASMCGGMLGGSFTRRVPGHVLTILLGLLLLGVCAATTAATLAGA